MDEFVILAMALGGTALASIGGLIGYKAYWQPHRRRRLERDHARSKLG